MAILIGFLTLIMVLDCVVLVLLVLIQLPKKEAGAGLAFGAGASDALFGAGSGTVLTKVTRWAATGFFVLAIALSMLQSRFHRHGTSTFEKELAQPGRTTLPTLPPSAPAQPVPPSGTAGPLTSSNVLLTPETPAVTPAPTSTTNTVPAK